MSVPVILCVAAALFSGAFGTTAVMRRGRGLAQWTFMAGMMAFAFESGFGALSLTAATHERAAYWQCIRVLAASFLPGVWLLFSITYSRGDLRGSLVRWRPMLLVAFAGPLFGVLGLQEGLRIVDLPPTIGDQVVFQYGRSAFVVYVLLLLSSVLVLMNLERTFRASVGTMRWRIKFMVLGLAVLFGVRFYSTSQTLLVSTIEPDLETLRATALLVACVLMTWSVARSGFSSVDIYPSDKLLRGSITLVIAGAYLLGVGALARLVTLWGDYAGFPLAALLVLSSLVILWMMLFSERVRLYIRRLISRHFKRPIHNYRQVWMGFAQRTSSLLDETDLCREVSKLVSDTFQVLSVTIWLVDDNQQQLVFGASTSLSAKESRTLLKDQTSIAGLVEALRQPSSPVNIDHGVSDWMGILQRCNPGFFQHGGSRICVPLVARQEVLGLISLGDRVNGAAFSPEDNDLLKCIADQVAASLLNLRLSQRLVRAKEFEAFQAMSAFFIHDLKNTAHTLSLLLQNLPTHFQDASFRKDALRAVSNSVSHINELIGRLGLLRHKLEIKPVEVDLNGVVTLALQNLQLPWEGGLVNDLRTVPPLLADPEHLQKVVTNLVLNAKDAVREGGGIRITTSQENDWLVLTVRDEGCGMSPEFVSQSLFRPFQTTKKTGIGIGMYHSKMIVEAHHGKMEVESEPGKGTTIRVMLPLTKKAT